MEQDVYRAATIRAAKGKPMNKKLAAKAVEALTAPGFEGKPGYCQKFARQVIQAVYGGKYNAFFEASAAETMAAFRAGAKSGGYEVVKYDPARPDGGSELGDVLYKGAKTSGKYGHVGIRVAGNKVAENSSAHTSNTDRESRGTRTLAAFGPWEYAVRLPE